MRRRRAPLTSLLVVALVLSMGSALGQTSGPAPQSSTVYFLQKAADNFHYRLFKRNPNNSVVQVSTASVVGRPAASPDGSRVAVSRTVGDGSLGYYRLWVMDEDGGNLVQITTPNGADMDPAWSPDGTRIAFSRDTSGNLNAATCCSIWIVNANGTGAAQVPNTQGGRNPSWSPDGSRLAFETPAGIFLINTNGTNRTQLTSAGKEPAWSPSGLEVAYVLPTPPSQLADRLRVIDIGSGAITSWYDAGTRVESPSWFGDTLLFVTFSGRGYGGRSVSRLRSVDRAGQGGIVMDPPGEMVFASSTLAFDNDEIMFYRPDGLFRFYDIRPDGSIPLPLLAGNNYTKDWTSITAVDLDGDGFDEIMFYRADGLFRFYDIRPDGSLPAPSTAGDNYTKNWTSITGVDLDGDGQDELFFYRSDGLYRYYDVRPDGSIPTPLHAGSDYPTGWTSISAIDLDGDGREEMFFYRSDGTFAFYRMNSNGTIQSVVNEGSDFPSGWSSVKAIDLDSDGPGELLFYRPDGNYRYQSVLSDGQLGEVIRSGSDYTSGWTIISPINLRSN